MIFFYDVSLIACVRLTWPSLAPSSTSLVRGALWALSKGFLWDLTTGFPNTHSSFILSTLSF